MGELGVVEFLDALATLTGGVYFVGGGATLQLADNTSIVTLDATIELSKAGATVQSLDTVTGKQVGLEATLTTIGATGELESVNGRGYATANAIGNSGVILLGGGAFKAASLNNSHLISGNGVIAAMANLVPLLAFRQSP